MTTTLEKAVLITFQAHFEQKLCVSHHAKSLHWKKRLLSHVASICVINLTKVVFLCKEIVHLPSCQFLLIFRGKGWNKAEHISCFSVSHHAFRANCCMWCNARCQWMIKKHNKLTNDGTLIKCICRTMMWSVSSDCSLTQKSWIEHVSPKLHQIHVRNDKWEQGITTCLWHQVIVGWGVNRGIFVCIVG